MHTQTHTHAHTYTHTNTNTHTYYGIHYIVGISLSGDGASHDQDGHYQITGRVDDVINTKDHRLGTAKLES